MDQVIVDEGLWQQVLPTEVEGNLLGSRQYVPLGIQNMSDLEDYDHNIFFYGNLTYAP